MNKVLGGALVLLLGACSVAVSPDQGMGIGGACQQDEDCHAGYCLRSPNITQNGICTSRCALAADCPQGSECVAGACHAPLNVGAALIGNTGEVEGWTYAHVQGLQEAAHELGYVHLDLRYGQAPGLLLDELRKLAATNRLILGNTVEYIPDFKKAARERPDRNFVCVDDGVSMAGEGSFTTMWIHLVQAWYVAGKLAARAAKANSASSDPNALRLGIVSAFVNPETVASVNAFTLGAQSVDPRFVVEVRHVGFWLDPNLQQSFAYKHKTGTAAVDRTYFREEYLTAQLVDSGCKVIAHLTNTQRSVRLIERLVRENLAPGFVASMANDNEQGCRSADGSWIPTCLGAVYENWRPLYRDLFEKVHFGTFDPSRSLDYDMDDTSATPTGVRINPKFAYLGGDTVVAAQVQQDFVRSKSAPLRQRVFAGPYRINGQRDLNRDGLPDLSAQQQVAVGELVSVAEMAKMCWYVSGVVEKTNLKDPLSADRAALVPGGLAPDASSPHVLYQPADVREYTGPKDLKLNWECTLNTF